MRMKPTKPVLKWAGGKRQLIDELIRSLPPKEYKNYIEPFIGGGALLFELQPSKAIINDYNEELTNMYFVIRDHADELIDLLGKYKENHSKEFYYKIRELDRLKTFKNLTDVERAARTIYLNRTCYNGLYRVNRSGYFNTPIGRYKNPQILDENNIKSVQKYLSDNSITIINGDFEEAIKKVRKDDFVYLDPPYYPLSKTSSFTSYTDVGFTEKEQERLKNACDFINDRGAFFLQSNSDCEYIRNLYRGYFFKTVEVRRSINSKKDCRSNIKEVLISNYRIGDGV